MRIYETLGSFTAKHPVLTIGMFDGVHQGHRQLINRINAIARENGGESVLLTFWPHPRVFFEKEHTSLKLLSTLEEKIELLSQTGIDSVIILPFNEALSKMTPYDYIKDILIGAIGAERIIIGYDHRYGFKGEGDFAFMQNISKELHFIVEEIPAFDIDDINVSSSKTRLALEKGDIDKANTFLSYDYFIGGTVVKGKQIGRELGYPTANINVNSSLKLVPANGVYIVEVLVKGTMHRGVLSIGTNPTIDHKNTIQSVEVYIFDFDDTIYDETIRLILKSKIRDEKTFRSVDELKKEIENDVKIGRNFFKQR